MGLTCYPSLGDIPSPMDYVFEYCAEDPETKSITSHIEGVKDGRRQVAEQSHPPQHPLWSAMAVLTGAGTGGPGRRR
jgi:hypothetical protein